MRLKGQVQGNLAWWLGALTIILGLQALEVVLSTNQRIGYGFSFSPLTFLWYFVMPTVGDLIFIGVPIYWLFQSYRNGFVTRSLAYFLIFALPIRFAVDFVLIAGGWIGGVSIGGLLILAVQLAIGIGLLRLSSSRTLLPIDAHVNEVFTPQIPFNEGRSVSFAELRELAQKRIVLPETMVRVGASDASLYAAHSIPGLFSDKSVGTAVVLGLFLGFLGIDRFYLGYTGLGFLKLITLGGCGLWSILDVLLIALRRVPDGRGRLLR